MFYVLFCTSPWIRSGTEAESHIAKDKVLMDFFQFRVLRESQVPRRQLNQAAGRHVGRIFTITVSQKPRAPICQLALDWEPQKPGRRKVNHKTGRGVG